MKKMGNPFVILYSILAYNIVSILRERMTVIIDFIVNEIKYSFTLSERGLKSQRTNFRNLNSNEAGVYHTF